MDNKRVFMFRMDGMFSLESTCSDSIEIAWRVRAKVRVLEFVVLVLIACVGVVLQ